MAVLSIGPAAALQPRERTSRFDSHAKAEPAAGLSVAAVEADGLPAGAAARTGWPQFVAEQGGGWDGWFDGRTGLPLLAQGRGILWLPAGEARGTAETLDALERRARTFIDAHPLLLGRFGGQLVLDRAASGLLGKDVWQLSFRQELNGVPVEGARYDFHVAHGNLVGFGASRVAAVRRGTQPALGADEARAALDRYLGADAYRLAPRELPALRLLPRDPRGTPRANWDGAAGDGLDHALAWRFVLAETGEPSTWVAEVDADSGAVLAFFDDTQYDRIKGGIFPVSNDGICPTGCEQPDFPLPFADYSENGGPLQYAGDHGLYNCSTTGSTIASSFNGKYIRVSDNCGAVSQTTTCDNPLDFAFGPGTDCQVPAGSSPGNTHSARSSFYHLNRVMEKGRAWLPDNTWLQSQVTDNVNINSTCNAYWNGSVNFYRSGGGCRNTGEIAGVFVHEWGHGLDSNDGGGYDNPSEAYADTVAFFETRESCIGRGFYMSQQCGGYGDTCLNCTGIRDQDWDKHQSHAPATPQGFLTNNCGGGGGPCGKEVHCEAYVSSETVWDLAVRDLPAAGLDPATAWQTAEQIFYLSRKGSGGNAYNCSLPNSDGCGTSSWFYKFRLLDDDDGNLNNGTPHAVAIFNAFKRHNIACGNASDASNQNSSSCPTLAKPVLSVSPGSNSASLSWTSVPGAVKYNILRNDLGCDRAQILIDKVSAPGTTYTDNDVSNGFTVYYRVQAVGSQQSCVSPVSDCSSSAAQPFAGSVHFDAPTYACTATMNLTVTDGNVGANTVTVQVSSDTETIPETVVLNAIAPGASKFIGSIATTSAPAVNGDGRISVRNADRLTARYIDANDGAGGTNVPRTDNSTADCVGPVISNVRDAGTTDTATTIRWSTDEVSNTQLVWGPTIPPGSNASGDPRTTDHSVPLSGLTSCTTYFYEVRSQDPAGNLSASNNGGSYYHFETLGNFGNGLQSCHQGRVTLDKPVWSCHDTATFKVVDQDINVDATRADTARVLVTSTSEPNGEWVTITETGANTSRFTGSIATASIPPAADGQLSTANGDTLTVTYYDANDGSAHRATAFASSTLDCSGPQISGLLVDTLTHARGTVRFSTSEPSDTVVEFGPTPALGFTNGGTALSTTHAAVINQGDVCTDLYFRVRTTDQYGNQTLLDNHGAPFSVHTWSIPGLYWRDSFEGSSSSWTLQGEFEFGPPQGRGGSTGDPDPAAAYNNQRVLGEDLSGRGAYPGDFEPNALDLARTPVLNASTWLHTKLLFQRHLQSGAGDLATLTIYGKGGQNTLWQSANGVFDVNWVSLSYDVSSLMDGQSQTAVEFRERADGIQQYSGWNVDDLILKDGSKPDFAACGACGSAPSFAGASSARDNNACGSDGVTVSWAGAVSWGSGKTGTYALYRGTSPGFPADAAHFVAGGITTLSYNDAAAPAGTLYYLVKAESDETCAGGPNNGGVLDANAIYAAVQKTTSRPLPAEVSAVAVRTIGLTHVRLTWPAAAYATGYNVYRSLKPSPGAFGLLGAPTALVFDDLGAAATLENYFYLVRGTNPCGTEGP